MIDFNLVSKKPGPMELRAYLYQLLSSNTGMTEDVSDYLRENCPSLPDDEAGWDLNALDDNDIINAIGSLGINGNLPLKVYYFKNEESVSSASLAEPDYKSFPTLFTGIEQVSSDKGGLIIMGLFNRQIYNLFNSKGEGLIGNCDWLDLGPDGLVLYRTPDSIFWNVLQFEGNKLLEFNWYGPLDSPDYFPGIFDRDMITEMFLPGSLRIPEIYLSGKITSDQIVDELGKDANNYRFLKSYYHDNKSIAFHAVNSNRVAFTLLSENLQNDREFVLELLRQDEKSKRLFPYLNENFKRDPEILTLCIDEYPAMLGYIKPVSDKGLILQVLKKDRHALNFASAELKLDRSFILEAVKVDWHILQDISMDLLTDYEFISTAIKCYNDNLEVDDFPAMDDELPWEIPTKETITVTDVAERLVQKCGYTKVLKLIAPVSDMNLIFKALAYTYEPDMGALLGYISEEVRNRRDFWLEAVKISSYGLKYAPEAFKHDREMVLAAVRFEGESLVYAGEELISDPEVFLAALEQIRKRRGACSPDQIIPLLTEKLISDRDFMLKAISLYPHVLRNASTGLRSNRDLGK